LQFSLAVIEVATNNFSQENRVGRGGLGEVYKVRKCSIYLHRVLISHMNNDFIFQGVLDGRQVVVKRLSINSSQGENEFRMKFYL